MFVNDRCKKERVIVTTHTLWPELAKICPKIVLPLLVLEDEFIFKLVNKGIFLGEYDQNYQCLNHSLMQLKPISWI